MWTGKNVEMLMNYWNQKFLDGENNMITSKFLTSKL